MASVSQLLDLCTEFTARAVAVKYILALAFVCALQLIVGWSRHRSVQKQSRWTLERVQGLDEEMLNGRSERSLIELENAILQDFTSQTTVEHGLALLLRRFVPNTRRGFAAVLEFPGGRATIRQCRGLSEESRRNIHVDATLLERIRQKQTVSFDSQSLLDCPFPTCLSPSDREKARQLFFLRIGENDEPSGLFVTTALAPVDASQSCQLQLAERLTNCIAGILRRTEALTSSQLELRSTQEMLQLRSIVDQPFDSPLKMVEQYLTKLAGIVGAERAALFVSAGEPNSAGRALVRCGKRLQRGIKECWQEHESLLFAARPATDDPVSYNAAELESAGITTLIGSAIVMPMYCNGRAAGLICLTRSRREAFPASRTLIVRWAVEYLADAIPRVLSQAVVERHARLDGLTELANRRTFDDCIERELRRAQVAQTRCSLLLLDLDRFKSLNDTYGHQAGDEVLRATACVLREQISRTRKSDKALVARYGGEEMVVLLPGVGLSGARRVAESVRVAIARTKVRFGRHEIRVTTSVGIATYPDHAGSVEELIAAADTALYQAKQSGRNCVCCETHAIV